MLLRFETCRDPCMEPSARQLGAVAAFGGRMVVAFLREPVEQNGKAS